MIEAKVAMSTPHPPASRRFSILPPDTPAHAVLIVAGLDGKIGRVEIFMLYAVARGATVNFKRLADWAAYVQRQSP